MNINLQGVSKETWIRTLVLFVSMVNSMLRLAGLETLPIADETIANIVSFVFFSGSAIAAWWYNNSVTRKAQEADKLLK